MFRPKIYPPPYYSSNHILPIRSGFTATKRDAQNEIPAAFRWKIIEVLFEFCSRSTCHGLPYFIDRKRHLMER